MKKYLMLLILTSIGMSLFAQESAVKWHTIQEAEKLAQKSPRPLFVDTYTDWCGWCKKMDKDTFTNKVISDLLNNEFYAVKFDAERKDSVVFMGQTFINDGQAGASHQLAVALLRGQMAFPTVVFLVFKDGQLTLQPVPGYKEPKEMEMLLSFFAGKAYETQKWEDYQKVFKGKIQ